MNIVNIGTDKSLVGGKKLGDAIERHRHYGEFVDHLDIIVYANKKENLKTFVISSNVTGYPTNSINKLFFLCDAIKIFRKINKEHKVDIVVCQDPFLPGLAGLWLKKKFGIKLQVNFHGDFWQNQRWLKERLLNFIFLIISKFVVPRADAIRVMSHGQKEKLLKTGISENKIRVISTPVDLEKFNNPDVEQVKKFKDISPYPKVLHVSRFDIVKDFNTLIKAFNIVYKKLNGAVHFWQVGANLNSQQVAGQFPYPAGGVHLSDNLEPSLLISAYHAVEVVVLSSISESFGKVLVEANACGKPVVSTATTGAKEIIQGGYNGFLVPIGDAQALADKIIYLLENPDKAKEMGENGRKLVKEKYGDNTQKIIKLWQDLINNTL